MHESCWPADLSDDDHSGAPRRAQQGASQGRARGKIRWLRPDYQIPRFGSPKEKAELDLVGGGMTAEAAAPAGAKPAFPNEDVMQTAAVIAALASPKIRSTPTLSPKPSNRAEKSRTRSPPFSRRWRASAM
ncbi:hypothetical protein [Rhodoblastus sp.]|uniref:hypothetical protein n=1 Tax=Rhodoblastus sp. TaxID=1962975 RepID=UPI003F9B158A